MSLPKIILARHGTPAWDFTTPISGRDLANWLEGERDAALQPIQRPSAELAQLVRSASCVIVSPLRRSIESASLIAPAVVPLIDEQFREPPLPCDIQSPLRLRPGIWTWRRDFQGRAETCRGSRAHPGFPRRGSRDRGAHRSWAHEHPDRGSAPHYGLDGSTLSTTAALGVWGVRTLKEGGYMKPTPDKPPKIPVPPKPQPPEPWEPAKIPRSPEPPKPPITKI
ncbi:MAG: hypothetical protein DMD66_14125 [Gemmatimonadetes bacterium]|nr:MAG: hypothetical protein DMD66_14125 [Gemmatimonadota bacterium]